MSKRNIKVLLSTIVFLTIVLYQLFVPPISPQKTQKLPDNVLGQKDGFFAVTKVVDGDTIEVDIDGKREKIRIIGINSPETVDPRREIECFGKEASAKAKELLSGQSVRLENDPSQAERDKYDRLLRYVFLLNGADFGKVMIEQGFAYEYTYEFPYKYKKEYVRSQQRAEASNIGLWGDGVCGK